MMPDNAISILLCLAMELSLANIMTLLTFLGLFLLNKYRTRKTTPTPFLPEKSNNSGSYK